MKLRLVVGALLLLGAMAIAFVIPIRHHAERDKVACHRLGPEFHWWDTRGRCVVYVDPYHVEVQR